MKTALDSGAGVSPINESAVHRHVLREEEPLVKQDRRINPWNAASLRMAVGVGALGSACAANVEPADDSSVEAVNSSARWNLSGWELQLPIGSTDNPQRVENPTSFSDAYFYVDTDGALTFMDPRTGVTTSGSLHPRSELRELTAGWSPTGTNTMTATVAVMRVPSTVTIAQIFQAPNAPSKPLCELQYEAGGHVVLFVEKSNEGGQGGSTYDVGTVTDGAKFTYAISLSKSEIAIGINTKTSTFSLPSSFEGEHFYFKWGAYDQTASAGKTATTPGTVVKFYVHEVVHK